MGKENNIMIIDSSNNNITNNNILISDNIDLIDNTINSIANHTANNIANNIANSTLNNISAGTSNDFLKELLLKQLKNINASKKLNYNDIKRISKFLTTSIFDQKECSIWNGYITNEKNQSKGTYINFYFNQKKIALHRLLYLNFIGDILNTEYIKFICTNKGKCCNINHMKKYTYNTVLSNINPTINANNDNSVHIICNKQSSLTIEL